MKRKVINTLGLSLLCFGLNLPTNGAELFYYGTNGSGYITVGQYIGPAGDVIVPDTIVGLPVTEIGGDTFANMTGITNVTIPSSVTNITSSAFNHCSDLQHVDLGTNLLRIGSWTFNGCSKLTSITIPDSVASISEMTFAGTGLTNISLGNTLTNLGEAAFQRCYYLKSAIMPDSLKSIQNGTFYACYTLTNVIIGAHTENIDNNAFYACDLKTIYARGSAPTLGTSVFSSSKHPYVYYLPGTTNWDSFSATTGFTNILWNPSIQQNDGCLGVTNQSGTTTFGFNITGTSNLVIVIEACDDLVSQIWSPVATNTLTDGSSYFSDPKYTDFPSQRFYRVHSPFGELTSLFPPPAISYEPEDGTGGSGGMEAPSLSSQMFSQESLSDEYFNDNFDEDWFDPMMLPPESTETDSEK